MLFNTGEIIFWEVFVALDSATILKRLVNIPKATVLDAPFNFIYALDGSIFVINNKGTVWHVKNY